MAKIECSVKMCEHNIRKEMKTFGHCNKEEVRIGFLNNFPICYSYNEKQLLCTYIFKGPFCGYEGTYTWCDKTFERCKNLGRHEKFTTTERGK